MKNLLVYGFTFCIFFLVLGYSIVNSLGNNPYSLNENQNLEIKKVLPQSWGFFSRNPREESLLILSDGGDNLNFPNANLKNAWGISRISRAQGIESGVLYKKVLKSEKKCNDYLEECLKKHVNTPYKKVVNDSKKPLLCGKYNFFMIKVLPYAWAYSTDEKYVAKKLYKVDVICNT